MIEAKDPLANENEMTPISMMIIPNIFSAFVLQDISP